jgi:hypothetical protein
MRLGMPNLYDEDQRRIYKVGQDLQEKWNYVAARLDIDPLLKRPLIHSKKNGKMFALWHEEAIKRYRDIGFIAEIDITPALAGESPPVISIVDRVEPLVFDFDKKAWEVKKSREKGGN